MGFGFDLVDRCSVYLVLIFIFLKNLWVCFTCLPFVGLFFSLDWVCFTICCLGLILGFFFLVGLLCFNFSFSFSFFKDFSSKFFLGLFFFLA